MKNTHTIAFLTLLVALGTSATPDPLQGLPKEIKPGAVLESVYAGSSVLRKCTVTQVDGLWAAVESGGVRFKINFALVSRYSNGPK